MSKKLKMFVWQDVLRDYTSGMMVVLAHDVEEARGLLYAIDDGYLSKEDIARTPIEVTTPRAFYVHGGG
jgi:hypothetical protein